MWGRAKKREYEVDDDNEDDVKPKAKAKRVAKPKEEVVVSPELQDFWATHGPSLLYRCVHHNFHCNFLN